MKGFIACCLICLPLKHLSLSSPFGYRIHPVTGRYTLHGGIDLRARNDTVFAVLDGCVKNIGYNDLLGVYIRLEHPEFESVYGHLSTVFVAPEEPVKAGDPIGITGATGRVTGEHLHFSITYRGKNIDPLKFLYDYLTICNNE